MPLTLDKLRQATTLLQKAAWRTTVPLDGARYLPHSPAPSARPPDVRQAAWQPIARGAQWGQPWQTVWLRQTIALPDELRGQQVALHLRWRDDMRYWSPDAVEGQVYLGDTLLTGIDPEHRLAWLPPLDEPSEVFVQLHTAQPQPFGGFELVVLDEPTAQIAHTFRVIVEALPLLREQGLVYDQLLQRLNRAYGLLDLREGPRTARFYESVRAAQQYVDAHLLAGLEGGTRPQIVATGHAHLDVAWLWPLWRTRQKAAHTFATMLHLMERYPEFVFTASTPQVYAFVKHDEPELYARIKQRIVEGRWEPIGAMWVEADCNVPSGESLVRQLVYGMRFFAEEFGFRDRVLWLPDVFGYSAALPQILLGCGIDTFMTTKISWSQFNRMPYDTFRWRGIDGSEVLTHFVTTTTRDEVHYTYNGMMTPEDVAGAWHQYRQKGINQELLYLVGYGDGGGGTTAEQIEAACRMADLPGLPQVRFGRADDYFARLHERVDQHPQLPTWVGELYLEYHRGTYTSQAWIKQANRRAEQLLHDAEFLDAWAALAGHQSRREQLREAWQLLLLNQFHDILPGSSIAQVYDDARAQFAELARIGAEVRDAALAALIDGMAGLPVVNTLGWDRSDPLLAPPEAAAVLEDSPLLHQPVVGLDGAPGLLVAGGALPAYSLADYTQTSVGTSDIAPTATLERLENQFFRIDLDTNGEIAALFDKRAQRPVLAPGASGNQLVAFEDRPLRWDAWDIDLFYEEKAYPLRDVQRLEVVERGPIRAGVELVRPFLGSTIRQRILIYRDLPRIDFQTEIDWHEHQILLKAAFPIDVNAARATHEIQFGAIERPTHRNTSWDMARFETCAQRWVNVSEGSYGVALLNDSKYGYDVHHNLLRLTLLKSGVHPDPDADQGLHRFTYALLPHSGDWRAGQVVRRAAELNAPLLAVVPPSAQSTRDAAPQSFISCDAPHVVVDTVKIAEDGDGLIVRLYEAHNQRGPLTLTFAREILRAERCNLLEERTGPLEVAGTSVRLAIRPFEIVTLRVVLAE